MGEHFTPGSESLWNNTSQEDCRIPSFPPESPWALLDPNSPNGLKAQMNALLNELGSSVPENDSIEIDEKLGLVYISPQAKVDSGVKIVGPCYIGPNCEIRFGAYVRPYTWACRNSVIGHSTEVKHSLFLPGAKAPHFNYVGDSILGSGVNLGAGTKLSNLRHDGKEVSIWTESGKIVTGLRKFGALLADGCQLGCNSVTNPGTILGRNCMVDPCATVIGIHPEESRIR